MSPMVHLLSNFENVTFDKKRMWLIGKTLNFDITA